MIPSLKVSNGFKSSQPVYNASHIKNININDNPQNNETLIYNNNSFNYNEITNLLELQALETPSNANTLKVNDMLLLEDNNDNSLSIGVSTISSNKITTNNRIYQELNDEWEDVNGYYALTKDSYPGVSEAYSNKTVSIWTPRFVINNWWSICWSPELQIFVAVGNSIMTSKNGINWTFFSSPGGNTWRSVVWSSKLALFVAVSVTGVGNRVTTSNDGIIWTLRNSPADNSWRSVCWSHELGLFVAVSSSGESRAMYSYDGINWELSQSPRQNTWNSVCWSPELGLFVAVSSTGNNDRIMISKMGLIGILLYHQLIMNGVLFVGLLN